MRPDKQVQVRQAAADLARMAVERPAGLSEAVQEVCRISSRGDIAQLVIYQAMMLGHLLDTSEVPLDDLLALINPR